MPEPRAPAGGGFADLLRRHRLAAELTQAGLAERAQVSTRAIQHLEAGLGLPQPHTARRLAEALLLAPEAAARFEVAARPRVRRNARDLSAPRVPGAFVPTPEPLVGRDSVVEDLALHLRGNGPPLMLLAGDPGIGKTRLLREAVASADAAGMAVLAGGCHVRGDPEPYAPVLEAIDAYVRAGSPAETSALLDGCAWLSQLMPELHDHLQQAPRSSQLPTEQQRRLMFAAVARLLSNVARRGSGRVALILDDLQWASRDGCDLLAFVAHAAEQIGLRVVGAYRETDVHSGPLAVWLADLARVGLVAQREVGPLNQTDSAQLLTGALGHVVTDQAVREQALRYGGGVPFFLVNFAQYLRDGDLPIRAESLPWNVTQSIQQRLLTLPPSVGNILDLISTATWHVARGLIMDMAGLPEDEVRNALDLACAAHLLEVAGDGTYRFSHDVVRDVVQARLGAAQRAGLHGKLGHALERTAVMGTTDIDTLAYHYARSDEDRPAARYLELAGDRARERQAHAAAEAHYLAAIERLKRLASAEDTARVCIKLAESRRATGQQALSLEALERAAMLYTQLNDLDNLCRTATRMERVYHDQGRWQEGIRRLDEIRRRLEAGTRARPTPAALAELNHSLAKLYYQHGEALRDGSGQLLAGYLAAIERSISLARTSGNTYLRAEAELNRAQTLILMRRTHEGFAALDAGIQLAVEAGSAAALVTTLRMVTGLAHLAARSDIALAYIERALPYAEELGDPDHLAGLCYVYGSVLLNRGDWENARAWLEKASGFGGVLEGVREPCFPMMGLGLLEVRRGDFATGRKYLDEALRLTSETGDLHARVYVEGAYAEAELTERRFQDARQRLEPLLQLPTYLGATTYVDGVLAWAYMELDQWAEAEAQARRCISRGRAEGSILAFQIALWIQARLEMHWGRWTAAQQQLEELLELISGTCVTLETRALETLATVHLALKNPEAARACLREACARFEAVGLPADVARVSQVLSETDEQLAAALTG